MSTPALLAGGLLCLLAAAMCLWAQLTGDLAPTDVTAEARAMPQHSSSANEDRTARLRPAPPDAAQPLPDVQGSWTHGRRHGWAE